MICTTSTTNETSRDPKITMKIYTTWMRTIFRRTCQESDELWWKYRITEDHDNDPFKWPEGRRVTGQSQQKKKRFIAHRDWIRRSWQNLKNRYIKNIQQLNFKKKKGRYWEDVIFLMNFDNLPDESSLQKHISMFLNHIGKLQKYVNLRILSEDFGRLLEPNEYWIILNHTYFRFLLLIRRPLLSFCTN